MQLEIRIIPEADQPAANQAKRSVNIETHERRGDLFNVVRANDVVEGEHAAVFDLRDGGRLVITAPLGQHEVVYDSAQGAAVRVGNQQNTTGKADAPAVNPNPGRVNAPQTPPTNPPRPQMGAAHSPQPSGVSPQNPTERAKQEQQNAPRPSGENAPKPGSAVGSPPDGNEGEKSK